MFRAFGHERSSILDGGLPRWESDGYSVESLPPVGVERAIYPTPVLNVDEVRSTLIPSILFFLIEIARVDYGKMASNSLLDPSQDATVELVLDARSGGR